MRFVTFYDSFEILTCDSETFSLFALLLRVDYSDHDFQRISKDVAIKSGVGRNEATKLYFYFGYISLTEKRICIVKV